MGQVDQMDCIGGMNAAAIRECALSNVTPLTGCVFVRTRLVPVPYLTLTCAVPVPYLTQP